jgi:hypothetical protein
MYILSAALDGEVAKPFSGGDKRCALLITHVSIVAFAFIVMSKFTLNQ